MIFSIPQREILSQLLLQLRSHFFITEKEETIIEARFNYAIASCEENFAHSDNKYYNGGGDFCVFNPYHSVQYMTFLYYLSHDIYKNANIGNLCDKIYYLNKIFHSVDLFYAIELPAHFGAEHPVGTVLGRAIYGDNFYFFQNCTVGGTKIDGKDAYPILGDSVQLCSNSSILGKCHIGDNVIIGPGSIVKNQDVPDCSIVFGQSPNILIKKNNHNGLFV